MAEIDESAGPSALRTATVMSEEDEAALETGIVATSADDAVNTTAEEAQIVPKAEAEVEAEAEQVVEAGAAAEAGPSASGDSEVKVEGQDASGDIAMEGTTEAEAEAEAQTALPPPGPDPNAIPDNACETLYIQNLNEKVQVEVMKQTLQNLFKPYRPLPSVTAHRNVRMRGQAFISFADQESANRARKDVHEFPLYGKPMIVQFARTRADAVVSKKEDGEVLEAHKKARLEDKKRKRRDNPLRRKEAAKRRATQTAEAATAAAAASVAVAKKPKLGMPDEYLPPNNILFLQNLPEGTTQEDLREVFEAYPGLVEIRTIPAKKDIAFIEYTDEPTAIIAKEALHNFKIDGETKMKVTYARK